MGRLIINYDDSIEPHRALHLVRAATVDGKISESAGVPHYCWCTVFDDCTVYALRKKKGQIADSFRVVPNEKKGIQVEKCSETK